MKIVSTDFYVAIAVTAILVAPGLHLLVDSRIEPPWPRQVSPAIPDGTAPAQAAEAAARIERLEAVANNLCWDASARPYPTSPLPTAVCLTDASRLGIDPIPPAAAIADHGFGSTT